MLTAKRQIDVAGQYIGALLAPIHLARAHISAANWGPTSIRSTIRRSWPAKALSSPISLRNRMTPRFTRCSCGRKKKKFSPNRPRPAARLTCSKEKFRSGRGKTCWSCFTEHM